MMESFIISKLKNEFIFEKKIICFVPWKLTIGYSSRGKDWKGPPFTMQNN
jgi:hypothetical protein